MFTYIFTHIPCTLYHLHSSPCLSPSSLLLLSSLPLSSLLLSLPRVFHFLVSLLWPSPRCSIIYPLELHSLCLPLSPALSLFFPSLIYPWELHSLSLSLSFSLLYLSPIPLLSIPSSMRYIHIYIYIPK